VAALDGARRQSYAADFSGQIKLFIQPRQLDQTITN
jgi:hypothetical protein